MNVPDEIRKCVAFLQYQSGTGLKLAGTVFFVTFEEEGEGFGYAVTAKHVVESIRTNGRDGESYFRVNTTDGGIMTLQVPVDQWRLHPTDSTTDIAVVEWPDIPDHDVVYLPIRKSSATKEMIAKNGIGIGDEVFMTGLFYRHHGKQRNIPILRVGNIATMSDEPVDIGQDELMEAHLVEITAVPGLSGSPLFVHLHPALYPAGSDPQKHAPPYRPGGFWLLGVMHGHWELDKDVTDELMDDKIDEQSINTGIAVVVPIWKVMEAIDQDFFANRRRAAIQKAKARNAPTPDASSESRASS